MRTTSQGRNCTVNKADKPLRDVRASAERRAGNKDILTIQERGISRGKGCSRPGPFSVDHINEGEVVGGVDSLDNALVGDGIDVLARPDPPSQGDGLADLLSDVLVGDELLCVEGRSGARPGKLALFGVKLDPDARVEDGVSARV
ncbi:MAG: hypothetical protein M3R04_07030 [bacterium]|nr:hypothetical protein [bacterium]